jgi:hypothetical protein
MRNCLAVIEVPIPDCEACSELLYQLCFRIEINNKNTTNPIENTWLFILTEGYCTKRVIVSCMIQIKSEGTSTFPVLLIQEQFICHFMSNFLFWLHRCLTWSPLTLLKKCHGVLLPVTSHIPASVNL